MSPFLANSSQQQHIQPDTAESHLPPGFGSDPRAQHLIARLHQLDAATADSALAQLDPVWWLKSVDSTNDQARLLSSPAALVISNQQHAGRGQSGRVWQSPEGNLYLSLLWTLQQPLSGRLALEAALALVNIPLLSTYKLQVKWPNDLYFEGAKWGGILIEPLDAQRIVIGVGLNLTPMQDHVPDQAVTDLRQLSGQPIDALELAVQVTQALIHACQQFDADSPDLAARFAPVDALYQQEITVMHPMQTKLQGVARGVCADGALIVNSAQGQKIIYSGQIRLAPCNG